jgi:hypothetical protein
LAKHQTIEEVAVILTAKQKGSRQYDKPPIQCSKKCHKASLSATAAVHIQSIWPTNLIDIIQTIVNLKSPCTEKPLFKFQLDKEAAKKNFLIMKRFNLDIGLAIEAQSLSPLGMLSIA